MHVCLLTGIPGLGKTAILQKIVVYLKGLGLTVGHADVESELQAICSAAPGSEGLVRLVGERPQDYIREKWKAACPAAIEKATAGDPDVAIVLARIFHESVNGVGMTVAGGLGQ